MAERPRITCLCGSTRFRREYEEAQRSETLAGRIVLSVGLFGHEEGIDMSGEVKQRLDALHLRKIDLSDEVLVIDAPRSICPNCGEWYAWEDQGGVFAWEPNCNCEVEGERRPYVGTSTAREIEYAKSLGKPIRWWSQEYQGK